ncbi:MAG: hypothetical protein WCK84_12665, partial [Bacteroidota bacterium]
MISPFSRFTKPFSLSVFLLLLVLNLHGEQADDNLDIKTILTNTNGYNSTYVKIKGRVSNKKEHVIYQGFKDLMEFTVTDNTDSINVLGVAYTLKNNDSVCVIGKYYKERKIGKYIIWVNKIDAFEGQIIIVESAYLQEQKAQEIQEQINNSDSTNMEDLAISVNQIETPTTKIITYASIIGLILTAISFIPVFLRQRKYNISLQISMGKSPRIFNDKTARTKFIVVEIDLYNINNLYPEINHNVIVIINKSTFHPDKITDLDNSEHHFPVRVERQAHLLLYFNFEKYRSLFLNNTKLTLLMKDQFS